MISISRSRSATSRAFSVFELLQAPDLVRLKAAETLAPCVDRLLADLMPLGHDRYRLAIGLAGDHDYLPFRETRFAHCSLRIGSHSLT